jgi:hypothetical protein
MRKRKAGMTGTMENSIGHNGGSPRAHRESIFGVVSSVAPAARDGHTCEISDNVTSVNEQDSLYEII